MLFSSVFFAELLNAKNDAAAITANSSTAATASETPLLHAKLRLN
jgi:hypothetical protein